MNETDSRRTNPLPPGIQQADVYREWDAPPAWRHAVACCWEQRVGDARVQRVLPDGCADVLVRDSGAVDVVGLHDEVSLPVLAAGSRVRGIRFRPAAVGAAFGLDASELRNRTVALADVVGTRRARLVLDVRALDIWIRSVDPDARATAALRALGDAPVADAADAIGVSSRQLRRIVLTTTGLGPKAYQRVVRLQRFLARTEAGAGLARAAAGAGYADQAHMTREVRRLSGLSPTALLAERGGSGSA